MIFILFVEKNDFIKFFYYDYSYDFVCFDIYVGNDFVWIRIKFGDEDILIVYLLLYKKLYW